MTIINGIEEETLIQRFIDGDRTAFELLFRYYYAGLVIFASRIILDSDEAEEIVQDFFVRMWTRRREIKNSASLKNYLFTCIKNHSLNHLKKEKVDRKVREKLKEMIETDRLYQPDLFVESEMQSRIKAALNKLTPRTKEVFTLSRFKDLSNDQIAEQLNLSKRTVETHISNALKILRNELKDYRFLLFLF